MESYSGEKGETAMIGVLIVDDCAVVRNGLGSLLKSAPQIKVVGEAASGLAALESVARLHPDVVLVDAQMPGLDGVETTRQIKAGWPGVKVLFLTVHTSYIEDARAAGADGHLMKDCTAPGLIAAIVQIVGGELRHCA
jgi:DNA-binding NarL/FixJ family response regulator